MNNSMTMQRIRNAVLAALLIYAGIAVAQEAPSSIGPPSAEAVGLQEIVVTATRQAAEISKVPISITAFSKDQMDQQGLKQIDDLVKFTPGLDFSRAGNGGNTISIRGISSGAGAATTGIYIDDTPIQARNIGYNPGSAFPALFDLERVEVLRGPQGTLFGAGSEGGTVRFIQTSPSLSKYSSYVRAEGADTQGGGATYELGGAFGGPLIDGILGFRISALYRRDGGYIDGVTGSFTTVSPGGQLYGKSIDYTVNGVTRPNTNWKDVEGFRVALKFAPNDAITITPSVSFQKQHFNDGQDVYWLATSNPSDAQYSRPVFDAGDPATNPALTAINAPNRDEGDDKFYLPAVQFQYDFGAAQLISDTSYYDRNAHQWFDFTNFYEFLYSIAPNPRPGDKAPSLYENFQRNFTQEIRIQSSDPAARLNWVAGLFFSRDNQHAAQTIAPNFLTNAPVVGVLGDPASGISNGQPFGPGSTAVENYFGVPLLPGSVSWSADFKTLDKQSAAFAQADFKVTEQLKVTAGLRFSRTSLDLDAQYGGAENNLNYALSVPCPAGTTCTPGQGQFAAAYPASRASKSENSTTPKIGVSYQLDEANLFYATAAKGFRPAGASLLVPVNQCGLDLSDIGYLDSNGHSKQPAVYNSDSVWSYELGSKNRLFGGRALVDASVYRIKWSNIQTSIALPICAYNFVDNVGHATSDGFDLGLRGQIIEGLTLGATFGYNKTTFDSDSLTPNGTVLYGRGSGVPNVGPPVSYSVIGEYEFKLFDDVGIYTHADFAHSNQERQAGQTSPSSSTYVPLYKPIPQYSVVNLRLGTRLLDGLDVSLFVNNVTNAHPELALTKGGATGGYPSVWTDATFRPRTYGVTLIYKR